MRMALLNLLLIQIISIYVFKRKSSLEYECKDQVNIKIKIRFIIHLVF